MTQYRALPFATYDLAVYLPGGAVLLILGQYAFHTIVGSPFLPEISDFGSPIVNDVVLAVLWLSASYLAGHLGAFLSAMVIERFVHNALGYPSSVWLKKEEYTSAGVGAHRFLQNLFVRNVKNYRWNISSILVITFLFPLYPCFLIFYLFKPFGFYEPKLPEGLGEDFRRGFGRIVSSISIEEGTRWEKIVEHYVANNCPAAYLRMYNYLFIYGALRLLSFILVLASWVILLKSSIAFIGPSDWEFSYRRVSLYIGTSIMGYMAMLAFAKFNRRYFEESILALLYTEQDRNRPKRVPSLRRLN